VIVIKIIFVILWRYSTYDSRLGRGARGESILGIHRITFKDFLKDRALRDCVV
jgi:hypothetical protein